MKKINCKIFIVTLLILFVYFFTASCIFCANAQKSLKDDLNGKLINVSSSAQYKLNITQDTTLAASIGKIISYILSMLGIIFLVLLVYGGFIWMLARGDSEEVNKSKDIIINAVIGIIIVLMSYAITYYVVAKLASTTMTGSGITGS